MRKKLLNSLLISLLMIFGTMSSWALTADLSMEYELVGYKAKAFYDLTSNDASIMPEGNTNLCFRSGWGLFNFGSGNRSAEVTIPVEATDILVCQFKDTQTYNATINSVSGCTLSTTLSDGSHLFFEVNETQSAITFNIGRAGCIVSVLVMEKDASVATVDYTVKYVCNGQEVKEAETRSGVEGQAIVLTANDTQNFYAADGSMKYIFVSSDVEGKTIADGVVVTLTFREAEKYAWTAKSNVGTYTMTGEAFEGDKVVVKYPLYVLVNGKLWTKPATNKVFAQSFDVTENGVEFELTYSETDIEAIYYTEVEDIEGMGIIASGNAEARSSQRAAGYSISGTTAITTLPAGKYKIVACFYSPTSAGGQYSFYSGNREIWNFTTGNSNTTNGDAEFVLAKESSIDLGQGSKNAAVDYLYIQSLGEPTPDELSEATAADQAADQAAALAEAKSILQQTITLAGSVNPEALADAISAAQTALDAEDATVETIMAAAETLETAVKDYLKGIMPNVVAIVQVLNTEALTEALATAQSVLNDENATALQLASAMQQLITAAQPAAATALGNLREYAEKYGTAETVALVDNALAAVAAGNVPEIISTMAAVKDAATPLATGVLTQLIGYADTYNINADAAKEALQGGNYIAMIGAARTLFNNLISAAQAYVDSAKAIPTEGKEGADELATAIDAAEQALEAETIDFSAISTAISNLIDAIAAFNEANAAPAFDPATAIVNPGFELCEALTESMVTSSDALGTDYESTGWKLTSTGAWGNGGVLAYGAETLLNGSNTPTEDVDGNNGNALAITVGWGASVTYQSAEAITIPAGEYTLLAYVYNANPSAQQLTSQLGFIPTNGTAVLSSVNSYPSGKWTVDYVTFTLEAATEGKFLLGGTAVSGGSGSNAKVFIDNITLTDAAGLSAAQQKVEQYNAAAEQAAKDAAIAANTEKVAGASIDNPIVTDFIVNGTFDQNINGWNRTGTYQNNKTANNQQGDFTGNFWENWNGSAQANKMYQVVENIPNGVYKLKIAAFVNNLAETSGVQYVFANNDKADLTTTAPTFYEVYTEVTNNTVEVGLEQTEAIANWMGIDNVSLTYYGTEATVAEAQALAARNDYNLAKADAEALLANEDYANVTGEELTALQEALNATPIATEEGYNTAKSAIESAANAFKSAKTAYDALAQAKSSMMVLRFPYASAEKKEAAEALINMTATNATDAAEKLANLMQAYRQYAESSALLEGIEGATNMTDMIVNPLAEEAIAEPWVVALGEGSGGSLSVLSNESFTDGEGNNSYKYFDGGNWGANSWDVSLNQEISLPKGKYLLSVTSRASNDLTTFNLFAGTQKIEMQHIGAGGGLFDRGWNDASLEFELEEESTVTIGVQGATQSQYQWMSFTRFRLMQFPAEVEPVEPEEPIEPAYGTIWEGNLVCADDAYTYLPLSTAYFKDFAQVGDIVRISFTDAGINSQGDDVEEDEGYYSRGAAPMRDMKRYADLKVLGSDKVTLIYDAGNSLQGDNQNVDLTINEDMLATLSEGDNIYVMGKNLTITKVELLEQAAAIEPFYGVIWEEGLVCESVTDFESVALSTVYFKDFVQAGDTVRVSYSAAGEDYQDMSRGLGPKRQMVKTGSLRLLDNSQQIIDERINLVDAASEDFIITEENMNQFTDGEYIYVAGRNLTIDKVELIEKGKEDSELMKEAKALAADEDAVAVGKLIAAIDEAIETEDESNLQAAVDQFKADNADQENDKTNLVAADGWKKFETDNAADLAPDWAAPAITTYDGRTTQPAEVYESTVETTGQIIYQNITGLTNGSYKVGFYAHAAYTSGRGFESDVQEGDQDVAYVFANEEKAFIPAHIATSIAEYQLEEFNVEVTDGTITLGLGKEKAGTNWHTMQIYRLTWFTTAKEVYAIDQENLQAAIAEASVLLDDATKTEGREALQTAINIASLAVGSNWYNIPEIETIIAELANAIYNFKLANQYIFDGVAYVIDAESGKFMAAGHDYGTRGIVNEIGLDLTFTSNETTRTVTIDSRVSNGEDNHFLGSNLYMDSQAFNWILEYQGFGFYISNGTQYINLDANDNLVLSNTPREWIIVTAEGVEEQRMGELTEATETNPVDATWLLQNPNFNRNDQRVSAWQVSDDCTNWNLNGGNQVNNCAESFHSTFTISQLVEGAPAGIYTLTAQGFYRQDGNVEEDVPVFFANDATAEVPAKTGEENSMSAASESFSNGLYTIEPLRFVVTEGGNIEVGVRGTATQQWVIFDNFQLTYYGADPLAADKAALQALIDECETLQESYYTPETWSALADALAAAYTALNASDATANSLAAAKDALQAAMDALVLSIDGINSLSATGKQLGTVYNLKGQKVSTPAKRLYIINGKKVVLK